MKSFKEKKLEEVDKNYNKGVKLGDDICKELGVEQNKLLVELAKKDLHKTILSTIDATLSEVERKMMEMRDTFRCSVCQKYDKKNKTWSVKKLYHTPQCNDGWIEPSGRTLINLIREQIIKELRDGN